MAITNNVVVTGTIPGSKYCAPASGDSVTLDSEGFGAIPDTADATMTTALDDAGVVVVDVEGTPEALTDGVVQTATNVTALYLRNSAAAAVINLRAGAVDGDIVFGPLAMTASEARCIVFPGGKTFTGGLFIETSTGALDDPDGYLIGT